MLHTRLRSLHPAPKELERAGSKQAAIESRGRHCIIETWNLGSKSTCGARKTSCELVRVVYELSRVAYVPVVSNFIFSRACLLQQFIFCYKCFV